MGVWMHGGIAVYGCAWCTGMLVVRVLVVCMCLYDARICACVYMDV